jgi:gluconokinase
LACSALKSSYRNRLKRKFQNVRFACLMVSEVELARRLTARTGHFFDPRLLKSQLAALEVPKEDVFDGTLPPQELITLLARHAGWE